MNHNITFTGRLDDGREVNIEIIQQRPDPSVGLFSRVEVLIATDADGNEIELSASEEMRLGSDAEKAIDEHSASLFDV